MFKTKKAAAIRLEQKALEKRPKAAQQTANVGITADYPKHKRRLKNHRINYSISNLTS